jgi:hypothetical protein
VANGELGVGEDEVRVGELRCEPDRFVGCHERVLMPLRAE